MNQNLRDARWVAERTGFRQARVYDMARKGIIPSVRFGRQLRFDPEQIETFIATGGKSLDEAA